MTNLINEIKKKLFENLTDKVETISTNQEIAIFMRKMEFGTNPLYFEYSFRDDAINQIYTTKNNGKKILYDRKQEISDSQELKKDNLKNNLKVYLNEGLISNLLPLQEESLHEGIKIYSKDELTK